MRRLTIMAVLLTALTVLAGCSGKPDTAACERAMRADYAKAMADPNGPAASRPKACEGVDDATVQTIANKILAGQ